MGPWAWPSLAVLEQRLLEQRLLGRQQREEGGQLEVDSGPEGLPPKQELWDRHLLAQERGQELLRLGRWGRVRAWLVQV